MTLKERLQHDLTQAMREKNELLVSTLRMAIAEIKNEEIKSGTRDQGLLDANVIAVLRKEMKKRQDAIILYTQGNDQARIDQEQKELTLLHAYVPAQASREQILSAVAAVVAAHPDATKKEFGTLMKEVMSRFDGNADGRMVSELLKEKLGNG